MATIGRAKTYTSKEFIQILLNNNFEYISCKGSHKKFKRNKDTIIINKDLNKMVAHRLIKTYNLNDKYW